MNPMTRTTRQRAQGATGGVRRGERGASHGKLIVMDEIAGRVADAYLELADEAVPDRVEGLYLVGSVALGDFHPESSDVDFVAVTASRLSGDDLEKLETVHDQLSDREPRPWFSGVYVTWDDLARDPREIGDVPFHNEGRFGATGGFDANPVQWLTLRTHPVAVRGTGEPTVWTDEAAVREWTLDNLASYWSPWVARQRKLVRGTMMLSDWAVGWGVLGVPRLHRTLATGEVVSKAAAGAYAHETFDDRWKPIVTEALRLRTGEGEQAEAYRRRPLVRRREALDFMTHVIDDARSRFGDGEADGESAADPAAASDAADAVDIGPAADTAADAGTGPAADTETDGGAEAGADVAGEAGGA